MRGGQNKKSIEEHINNGTWRPDRYGYILPSDEEAIKTMKQELYNFFIDITKKIKKADIDKQPDSYKLLNEIMMNQIKTFHSIAKTPMPENKDKEHDKDGFKTL